jgi:DNA-binding CsgD family transcriptional regulator
MQQIIDQLYYSLASGKHLMFFYLTVSYSIGLPSLVVLILAHLKSRWKALTYLIYLLLAKTGELISVSYLEYQHANVPFGVHIYQIMIIFSLESLVILLLPFLVNEIFGIAHRRQINYIFGVLFGIGLALIIVPYFLGIYREGTSPAYLQKGISIEALTSFKIYRLLFWGAYLYAFLVGIRKIKTVHDLKERNFYIYFMAILLALAFQTIVPVIKTFPENLFIFATGYFLLNILLLKYMINRFFEFSKPTLREPLDELITNREKEILLLLAQGLANKAIGAKLCITETTVKSHVQNIYKKVGVSNRVQLLNSLRNYLD